MSDPWFDPNTFGAWFGTIVGGVGGSLFGLLGALSGLLIPRGQGWTFLTVSLTVFLVLGVLLLTFAGVALVDGQPYGIWFGPLLSANVFLILSVGGLIMVRLFKKAAEQRRLDSEALRNS